MTIDFVKKYLNRYLNYAKAPNNGFQARDCYNVAFGMAHMRRISPMSGATESWARKLKCCGITLTETYSCKPTMKS